VVKTVTNETVTGRRARWRVSSHAKSSIADKGFDNDVEALLQMRRLIDFLPSSNTSPVPELPARSIPPTASMLSLDTLIPANPNQPYDMKELILKIADEGDFFEIQDQHARNIITGLGPHQRRAPSASSPISQWCWPACLDSDAGRKGARFVQVLRLLQHSDRDAGRRAGLPAGHGAGIWRPHQAWREVALRLCRGDGAEDHRHHPQGLWRRLCRHGVETSARRRQLCLARPPRSP
jgi:hypothetical protein